MKLGLDETGRQAISVCLDIATASAAVNGERTGGRFGIADRSARVVDARVDYGWTRWAGLGRRMRRSRGWFVRLIGRIARWFR
jgi:hypothetical protein